MQWTQKSVLASLTKLEEANMRGSIKSFIQHNLQDIKKSIQKKPYHKDANSVSPTRQATKNDSTDSSLHPNDDFSERMNTYKTHNSEERAQNIR